MTWGWKYQYRDKIVGISAMEVGDANALRKRVLSLEALIQALTIVWLYTHGLQDEHAHAN